MESCFELTEPDIADLITVESSQETGQPDNRLGWVNVARFAVRIELNEQGLRVEIYPRENENEPMATAVISHEAVLLEGGHDPDTDEGSPTLPSCATLVAAPALLAALELGRTARAKQAAYFKDRTQENLIASKQAEKAFDDAARAAVALAKGGA